MNKILVLSAVLAMMTMVGCSGGSSPTKAPADTSSATVSSSAAVSSSSTAIDHITGLPVATVIDPVTGKPVPVVVKPLVRRFSLSFTSPASQGRVTLGKRAVATTEPTDFDMGLIKSTKSYQFILVNNSTDSLTDIVISTTNSKFSVVPAKIRSIGAPTMQIGNNVIIQVTAIHGKDEGGVWAPPITEVDDTTRVTVAGKFGDSTFSVSYTIRVVPSYLEFKEIDGSNTAGTGMIIGHNCPITYSVFDGSTATSVTTHMVTADTVPASMEGYARQEAFIYYSCATNNPSLALMSDVSQIKSSFLFVKQ